MDEWGSYSILITVLNRYQTPWTIPNEGYIDPKTIFFDEAVSYYQLAPALAASKEIEA